MADTPLENLLLNLHGDPGIRAIARDLKIDEHTTVGAMVYAIRCVTSRDVTVVKRAGNALLDRYIALPGFSAALKRHGWLAPDGTFPPLRKLADAKEKRREAGKEWRDFGPRSVTRYSRYMARTAPLIMIMNLILINTLTL